MSHRRLLTSVGNSFVRVLQTFDARMKLQMFNPSETLQGKLKKSQIYKIQPVYNRGRFLLWKLEK
ncbi:MAG: hypothetical protein KME29_17460 [Calothrix sp. FI2-JRJ7]|nr:hypothetical protein [Calothrix sp. FI2-JRJ7]